MLKKSLLGAVVVSMAAFVSSCAVETTTEEKTAGKLNFSELSETFEDEGSFTALEILANVSGEKTGYSLKEIKDISNTSVATLGQNQTSIDFETTGAFTASLVFEHATKDDAVIDKAPFKILETSENILSEKFNFSELSKRFTSGGSFTALEILANVVGEKTGYSLKEIKDISDTSVARISGNKKRINFIQAGTFTATLILEHTTKEDVTIPNATFQILRTNALAFNLLSETFTSLGSFTASEILANVVGEKTGYSLKEIKDLSDTSVAQLAANKKNIDFIQAGIFTATLILEHATKADITIPNATFRILKGQTVGFTKLKKINSPFSSFEEKEILGAVTGIPQWSNSEDNRGGWKLKEVKDISDTAIARLKYKSFGVVNKKAIRASRIGEFTATIVLEKDNQADLVIPNAEFETEFIFAGLSKTFVSGGSFSEADILSKLVGGDFNSGGGNSSLYSFKEIKDISDTSVAKVGSDGKSLDFIQAGSLTATLVIEKTYPQGGPEDVVIQNAKFEITQTPKWEKGFANTSAFFFYYPKDHQLYFASTGNSIYKMNVDGSSVQKIYTNTVASVTKPYVYVHQDWIYYNDSTTKKIYKVKTDGSSHSEFISNGHGDMRVYGDDLYYFKDNTDPNNRYFSRKFDLMRVPLDKSSSAEVVVEMCECLGDPHNFHVKNNQVYYSKWDTLRKMDLTTKKVTTLSRGMHDGFILTEDYIYFRNHSLLTDYGIGRANYDFSSVTVVHETLYQVNSDDINFNVSPSFITYINRESSGDSKHISDKNLYYLDLNAKTENLLRSSVSKSGSFFDPPQVEGNLKIIGDWIYYLREFSTSKFEIRRVKKDGSSAELIHQFQF